MTGDLINITPLQLSDTFNTWLDRTNEIISELNPLQIYDIQLGATGGLYEIRGGTSSYNGVVTIALNPGPGIGTRTYSDGSSHTIVDFALYDSTLTLTGGLSSSNSSVAVDDEYIVNDVSDTSLLPTGKAKKVKAKYMLPPYVEIPSFTINGDLIVNGNIFGEGDSAFIAQNNLRIEDKQIELAYQQAFNLSLTGVSGGSFNFAYGAQSLTGYYALNAIDCNSASAAAIGYFIGFTAQAAGPTGTLGFGGPFSVGGWNTVGTTGYIVFNTATGSTSSAFTITNKGSLYNNFLSDTLLSEGGIVLKGISGDKSFLWIYQDDSSAIYNGWISNFNLGVSGSNNYIISRNFRSYGYSGGSALDSQFFFTAEQNQATQFFINETNGGAWRIQKASGTGSSQNLYFSHGQTNSQTLTDLFNISTVPAGTTYPGVSTTSFASGFNADLLDGAHSSTASTPYTIPVAGEYGKLPSSWLEVESIVHRINQTGHALVTGDVLRITATGNYVKAIATSAISAEVVGVVSEVPSANQFVITQRGRISTLSGLTPGEVYFLSGTVAGGLISDPALLSVGQIRKPVVLARSATDAYVMNYVGVEVFTNTDEVYLPGLVPVGTIYPYSGQLDHLSDEWLVCDGDRYTQTSYPDLYHTVGNDTYYAEATATNGSAAITLTGGIRNITAGDTLRVYPSSSTTLYLDLIVTSIDVTNRIVTFTTNYTLTTGSVRVYAKTSVSGDNIFFVPDLRTRVVIGVDSGDSEYSPVGITQLTEYSPGDVGGSESVVLTQENLPPHAHTINTSTAILASGSNQKVFGTDSTESTNLTGGSGGSALPFANLQPYLATHYIIRAKKGTPAIILTGHNHDNRYIRWDAPHPSVGPTALTGSGRDQFRTNAYVSGLALGSLTSATGDYHDHDLRYPRYDMSTQGLTLGDQYNVRINTNTSAKAEGDGLYALGAGQTQHNHDNIYVRFDTTPQSVFGSSQKAYFRSKIDVYSTSEANSRYFEVAGDTVVGPAVFDGVVTHNNGVTFNLGILQDISSADTYIKPRTLTLASYANTVITGSLVNISPTSTTFTGTNVAFNAASGRQGIQFGGQSDTSFSSGSTLSLNAGSLLNLKGAVEVKEGGYINVKDTGVLGVDSLAYFNAGVEITGGADLNGSKIERIKDGSAEKDAVNYSQLRKNHFVGAFIEPPYGATATNTTDPNSVYSVRNFRTNPFKGATNGKDGFDYHGFIMIRVEDSYRSRIDEQQGAVAFGLQNILHFPFPFSYGNVAQVDSDEDIFTNTQLTDGVPRNFPANLNCNQSGMFHTVAEGYALYKLSVIGANAGDLFLGVNSAPAGMSADVISFKFFKRDGANGFTGTGVNAYTHGQKVVRFVVFNREYDVGAAIYG